MNTQIALVILGNPNSRGGMQPLTVLGKYPSEEFENLDSYPVVKENLTYRIRHTRDCITYTVKNINVRPADSGRDGSLIISIAIPRVLQLKDNQSPYTLLKNIYDIFVADYMVSNSDGGYVFKIQDVDKATFAEILQRYEVEDRRGLVYVPMQDTGGVGVVCAKTEEQLAELFRDSQYNEFRNYCHIEIGRTCLPTVNIDIPRKKEYSVYLNDSVCKKLANGRDRFDSSEFLRDSDYRTWKHVKFTLDELIESENGELFEGRVKLEGHKIICKVPSENRVFDFTPKIVYIGEKLEKSDQERILTLLKNGTIKIKFGVDDITEYFTSGLKYEVRGSYVEERLTISPSQTNEFDFRVEKNRESMELILKLNKRAKPSIPNYPIPRGPVNTVPKIIFVNNNQNDKYRVTISSPGLDDLEKELSFKRKDGRWEAELPILDKRKNDVFYKLELLKDGKTVSFYEQQLFFENGRNEVKIDIRDLDFTPVKRKKPFNRILTLLAISSIFSFAVGFFVGMIIQKDLNEKNVKVPTNYQHNPQVTPEPEDRNDNSYERQTQGVNTDVVGENAPQEDVMSNPPGQTEQSAQPVSGAQPVTINDAQPVPDYKSQIVESVNNQNWKAVQELVVKAKTSGQISQKERDAIESLWWDKGGNRGKGGPITDAQRRKRDRALKGKQVSSIEDIMEIAKIIYDEVR